MLGKLKKKWNRLRFRLRRKRLLRKSSRKKKDAIAASGLEVSSTEVTADTELPNTQTSSSKKKLAKKAAGKAAAFKGSVLAGISKLRASSSNVDWQNFDTAKFVRHATAIRWTIGILAIFLLSHVVTRVVGLWIRPIYPQYSRRAAPMAKPLHTRGDYSAITRRNMFNVEGTIPEPFDQGMLDCFAQATKSNRPITLLATIVMDNEKHSVALIQPQSGGKEAEAVSQNDTFMDKYVALKVERQRVCFQIKSSQELEYIEVKDDLPALDTGPSLQTSTTGINAVTENKFTIRRDYLNDKMQNLNQILQTARAVPYVDASGQFKGFLIQSIQSTSPFYELGVRQGDILTGVNDIKLDHAGKGLEAFQRLRNSTEVKVKITRAGQEKTLSYSVQ